MISVTAGVVTGRCDIHLDEHVWVLRGMSRVADDHFVIWWRGCRCGDQPSARACSDHTERKDGAREQSRNARALPHHDQNPIYVANRRDAIVAASTRS
jgi:hypothetical protein